MVEGVHLSLKAAMRLPGAVSKVIPLSSFKD
jgi:hypothetical protein